MRRVSGEPAAGVALALRLRSRRAEIEEALLTRVHAVSEPPPRGGPEYAQGLREAVAAGIEHGLGAIERGERDPAPVPDVLLAQARLAARSGVSLDTVLRRYFAGHVLLGDFMAEEAERERLAPAQLKCLLRSQAALVDRLLAAVSGAYAEEVESRRRSSGHRRAELIERLLGGEPLDAAELGYELGSHHLALIATGPLTASSRSLTAIARSLDARLLSLPREDGALWAWLGRRRALEPEEVLEAVDGKCPQGSTLALGESAEGPSGWRLTHRQARAALSVARRGEGGAAVRYRDVALLASVLQDELLATSLRKIYLEPLEEERDDGTVLRETLRAYFAAGGNVSSAAASLGVKRHTVSTRLRAAEEKLGRSLAACGAELELGLRLGALRHFGHSEPPQAATLAERGRGFA